MTSCPNCGGENAPGARFCSNCGHSLVTRVAAEERRHVAALFTDLVASTALSESLDPEVVRGLVARFFERATNEIRRHGGSVEKFSGDAVMALFGLQQAHEDDPERAVRAAFAVRDALAELAPDAAERHGITLQLRIGIEAGEVVVGDPFGGATMATGDPLNLAARFEQFAQPGEILVGPAVHDATSRAIAYTPAGDREVHGKAEPIPVWRAEGILAEVGEARGIEGREAALTGRDEELDLLREAARRARHASKAMLFTVLGAPGVGKSRLTRELTMALAAEGWRTMRGRCLPYGEGITYWPIGEIVRSSAGIAPDLSQTDAVRLVETAAPDTETASRLAFAIGLTTEAPVSGEALGQEIAWAFRRYLEADAADRPLLVVFEDIHWAEPPLLDLIEYLATWIRERPVLLLCLARPELVDRRPTWGAGRMEASRLQLEPLSRKDSATLVRALLHVEGLPDELRDRVLDRAEGNPLFVEETVRMLIDRGAVVERGGRWVATDSVADIDVPHSIEALIRARLDGLPRDERTVLQGASVIGRVFQRAAVATLVEEPVERQLEQAVLRDIVTEEPSTEPAYRFKHILIRDVAYASLPKARRADLHRRVVDWLSAWSSDRREEFVEIEAYHLEQAAQLTAELEGRADSELTNRAVSALERSARKAAARDDLRAVVGFAERGLALKPTSAEQRMEIQMLLVSGLELRGDLGGARKVGEELAEAARAAGRHDLRGRALRVVAYDVWIGLGHAEGREAGVALMNEAREELTRAGDEAHLSDVVFDLGWEGWWLGDIEKARARWEESAAIARRIADPAREIRALVRIVQVHVSATRMQEAEEVLARAEALAEGTSRLTQGEVRRLRGTALFFTGTDTERGKALLREALQVAEECGARELQERTLQVLADVALIEGDVARAIGHFEEQVRLLTDMGDSGRLPEADRQLAAALVGAGDVQRAEWHALRAVDTVGADDWFTVASSRLSLAMVRSVQGRGAEAAELFAEARETLERTAFAAQRDEFLIAEAEFHLAHGRTEEGERLLAESLEDVRRRDGPKSPVIPYFERRAEAARGRAAGRR